MSPQRAALFFLLTVALLPMRASNPRGLRERATYKEPPELTQLRLRGNELFRAGDYAGAGRIYQAGVEEAQRRGATRSAIRFLNNLGGVSLVLLRYRDAARAYLQARTLATEQDDPEMLAATAFNLSSIYLQLGEIDAAREAADRGLAIPTTATDKYRANLLIQSALVSATEGDCDSATPRLREAIGISRDRLDAPGEAQAWNELGNTLLDCKRPAEAEDPLLESYRLRKLARDPRLSFSYESLAELRLAQNNPEAARLLLDRAVESAGESATAALWRPLHARGRAYLALGRTELAYRDLRDALRHLRDWRREVLPADAFRVRSEAEANRVYGTFVEAAAARLRESGDRRYAAEAFIAAETGRAESLRALWTRSGRPQRLPPEYWRTRDELHRAESEQIRGGADEGEARNLRARLAEMEAAAGLDLPPAADGDPSHPGQLLELARGALGPDEAFVAFFTGEHETAVWALTRTGLEMASAPAEGDLRRGIAAFVEALRESRPEARELGARLFHHLFGKLGPRVRALSTWTVAPDGPLFDLPFSALTEGGRYAIEHRTLRVTTGVWALLRPPARGGSDAFVGLGDPIYNRADGRQPPGDSGAPALELSRLPGSGREVRQCAAVWQSHGLPATVLEGVAASKESLLREIGRGAGVVHLAAHMLFPGNGSGGGMMALSMQPGGEVELLSDTEVAGMETVARLIVLNGCSSGRGDVLPGAGLMGMTRAWLAAGARAVVATRWPAPDQDAGAIFESLYRRHFEREPGARSVSFAELLRDAQLAELRAGGKRADPSRWASYFCVETK